MVSSVRPGHPTGRADPLRVLHINTTDQRGGAARSARLIHLGLQRLGVGSRMLVGYRTTNDPDVDLVAPRGFRTVDRWAHRVTGRLSLQYLFFPSSVVLPFRKWVREADVLQLYNLHGGYVSPTALPRLTRGRVTVWRLSDMWPFTGHCVHSFDCERWKTGCGRCPILSDPPELYRDTTAGLFRLKACLYRRSKLTIVAPTRWIGALAAQSPLLSRFECHLIPNGVDTAVFRPMDRSHARRRLGLPLDGRVVLFAAEHLSERKGATALARAMQILPTLRDPSDVTLLTAGAGECGSERLVPRLRALGAVQNDEDLATAYAAADLFVLPTLADNLPNVILESMACATPVLTFDVGGCPEAVRHLQTGYVARYGDAADLARGLAQLLDDATLRERLGLRAREVACREYSTEIQARRFLDLYDQLLSNERTVSGC